MKPTPHALIGVIALVLPTPAAAQDTVQPGEDARKGAAQAEQAGDPIEPHYNAFDAPTTLVVVGKRLLKEEEPIGDYSPADRLPPLPTTRVYVRPEGQFAFEYWLRATSDLGPSPRRRQEVPQHLRV
ncbi:MAG: hypothetical protein R3F65_03075 [bacterium]